jgi:hypothetical protein
MTKQIRFGFRMLIVAIACTFAGSPCRGDGGTEAPGDCAAYPIALYPDPNAQARAEGDLLNFAPGATMTWHPARGTFWFVTLSVPLPQCGPQADVYTPLFALTRAHPDLFQLDLKEWKRPPPFPCGQVAGVAKVLELQRAKVGSHPISHDLMKFTVQRVNGVVRLQALFGEYLPQAAPWLDASLSACPNLNQALARQVVLDSEFTYSIFDACYYMGSDTYSPDGVEMIAFLPGASWAWQEDPTSPRVLFRKSTQGRLVLDPANYTPDLLMSDANCPGKNGQPNVGFRLTLDSVTNGVAGYQAGLNCIVCLR